VRGIVGLAWMLVTPIASSAQSPARPEILVLGTYHMGNPGRDIHNTQADDVLAPKRQQEIAVLVEVLKKFRPTKVAVESDVNGKRVAREYAGYLAGTYTLAPNEIDQIGYRLAKALGHKDVYPVDVDGDFPYYRVLNYAKANGLKAKFDSMEASVGARVKRQNEFLLSHSVLETLEYMNADSMVAKAVGGDFAFAAFGDPFDYAGPDLLASWYQRNIRIYRNILALASSPNDRILVVYGSGHLGPLRQAISNDPSVQLRKLSDLRD
jgi:uncharacterized protein DUF5694